MDCNRRDREMAMVESCPRDKGQRLDGNMTTLLVSNMSNDTLCGKVNPMTLNDLGLPQGEIGVSLTHSPPRLQDFDLYRQLLYV